MSSPSQSFGLNSSEEIPSVMETVGFDLAPFDAASGMAGTMKMAGVVPDGTTCDSAGRAPIMFETEHVIDPLVKFGDRVTAGQRIATVSDYDRNWKAMGYGLVEIGIAYNLGNDGSPWHACPSRFFAPTAKNAMLNSLTSLMTAWSTEVGNPALYAQANNPEPGCLMVDVHNSVRGGGDPSGRNDLGGVGDGGVGCG